eukprot:m.4899 g.4899  ORF g.4899 m.4899 type:complete len:455 (+) comp11517_c0_seq1:3957-5321(+)
MLCRQSQKLRRCVLVALDWTRSKDPPMSLGHASILTSLTERGFPIHSLSFSANSLDTNPEGIAASILSAVDKDNTAVVSIGAYIWAERLVQSTTTLLREGGFLGDIVVGGPQVSYCSKGVLDQLYPHVNVFIRGYAEKALGDVISQNPLDGKFNLTGIPLPSPGVYVRGTKDLGSHALIDLGSLPSPFLTGAIQPQPFVRWETQRGCPFSCSFCQHREPNATMKRRHFSGDRILNEADWLAANKVSDVAVLDPTFNAGPRYLSVLERLLENGFKGKLSLQCRFEMVKPEFVLLLTKLRRAGINVVPEFGLQTIIKDEEKVIGRRNNLKRVDEVMKDMRQNGIPYEVSLIYGLPMQTVKSFKNSVNFCLERSVPVLKAFPLMLLRGTPLEEKKAMFGLIESEDAPFPNLSQDSRIKERINHVVSCKTFTITDWKAMAEISLLLEQTEGRHPASVS